MELLHYQREAHKTAIYPEKKLNLTAGQIYVLFGLGSETGETLGVGKKALRGDFGKDPVNDPEFMERLEGELGGMLWYVAEACNAFGLSLRVVAEKNIETLKSRQDRGVLQGDGDER